MRRGSWAIAVAVTMSCLFVAPAGASKARAVEQSYSFDPANGGSIWVSNEDAAFASAETLVFKTARSDHMVSLAIADESAASVSAAVWQGEGETTVFCNELEALPVTGGKPLNVRIIVEISPAGNGCATPEMPSAGTVTATFSSAGKATAHHQHHHH